MTELKLFLSTREHKERFVEELCQRILEGCDLAIDETEEVVELYLQLMADDESPAAKLLVLFTGNKDLPQLSDEIYETLVEEED